MMLIDRQADRRPLQEPHQRVLTAFQRIGAEVLTIQFDQVERSAERSSVACPAAQQLERGEARIVRHHAPPSIRNERARSADAAATIAG